MFFGQYNTKCEIYPGPDEFSGFWDLVLPEMLRPARHQKKGAMRQRNPGLWQILAKFMTQLESPGLAKADAGNDRIDTQVLFIITVPADAVFPVAVEV